MSSFSDSDFELDDVEEGTSVAQVSAQPADASSYMPPMVAKAVSSSEEEDMGDLDDFDDEDEEEEDQQDEEENDEEQGQASPDIYNSTGQNSPKSRRDHNSASPQKSSIKFNRDGNKGISYDIEFLKEARELGKLQISSQFPQSAQKSDKVQASTGKDYIRQNIASTKIRVHPVRAPPPVLHPTVAAMLNPQAERKKVDVKGRFYDKAEKAQEKRTKLKAELEQEKLSECTFKPEIINKKQPRNFDDFISENYTKDKQRQDKIKRLQDERLKGQDQQTEEFSYKPKLCEKSVKMQKESTEPAYLKLYNSAKSHVQKKIELNLATRTETESVTSTASDASLKPFTPQLNKKSHELVREGRIDELLYADAKRRTETHKQSVSISNKSVKEKFISSTSDQLLRGKFLAEYSENFEALELEAAINYTQFKELMTRMRFITPDAKESKLEKEKILLTEFWKELAGEEPSLGKDKLEEQLLTLMGFQKINEQGEIVASEGKSIGEIHLKYFALYENRVYSRSSKAPPASTENYSFKPQIDSHSEKINRRRPGSQPATGRHEDQLIAERDERLKRIEKLRLDTESKQLKDCTFKPQTNKLASSKIGSVEHKSDSLAKDYIDMMKSTQSKYHTDLLYNLAAKSHEKQGAKTKEAQAKRNEEESKDCTFKPDRSLTTTNLQLRQRNIAEIPGTEEIIQRIKKGRAEHQWNKSMKERGLTMTSSESASSLNFGVQYKTIGKGSFDAMLFTKPKPSSQTSYLESLNRHRETLKSSSQDVQVESEASMNPSRTPSAALSAVELSQAHEPEIRRLEFSALQPIEDSEYSLSVSQVQEIEEPYLTITVNLSPTLADQLVIYSINEVDSSIEEFALKNCKG